MDPPKICKESLEAANDVPACSCECKDRFEYGADEEEYLVMLLWPPAARTPEVVDLARSQINEVADVVQWARFDPGANFSAFLYEVYSSDKFFSSSSSWSDDDDDDDDDDDEGGDATSTDALAPKESFLGSWTQIEMKRDWFAAHAEQTGTECVFALIKLMPSGRGHGHAAHEEHLKKPIGFADASRRLKLSIRDAIRRSGLIPDYNFYRGRDMNRNTASRRKVAVHTTDSVYQTRATRLVAQRYLLM